MYVQEALERVSSLYLSQAQKERDDILEASQQDQLPSPPSHRHLRMALQDQGSPATGKLRFLEEPWRCASFCFVCPCARNRILFKPFVLWLHSSLAKQTFCMCTPFGVTLFWIYTQ